MSSITFNKMHGLGNDFMVINAIDQKIELSEKQIRELGDRHLGVGFDQLLLIEKATQPGVDFNYRIFNSDGSEVEQCGNGARCFARFVIDEGLSDKSTIKVSTKTGLITLQVEADNQITVDMGVPTIIDKKLLLQLGTKSLQGSAISMGNPHCVVLTDDIYTAPIETDGREIAQLPQFPEGVNVGFMEIISPDEINLRVLERGAGETLACGSGACAAVVAGQLLNKLRQTVTVHLPGGDLVIRWQGPKQPVLMTGPANHVYRGEIRL